jgi:hypothetical protein
MSHFHFWGGIFFFRPRSDDATGIRSNEMKHATLITAALLAFLILAVRAGDKKVDVSKVHGRIQYVKSFPDYKVKAVTSFPDLRVQVVESFPTSPGQWQIVDSFPDYKIEMVESFPDFTVQFVSSFPGPAK